MITNNKYVDKDGEIVEAIQYIHNTDTLNKIAKFLRKDCLDFYWNAGKDINVLCGYDITEDEWLTKNKDNKIKGYDSECFGNYFKPYVPANRDDRKRDTNFLGGLKMKWKIENNKLVYGTCCIKYENEEFSFYVNGLFIRDHTSITYLKNHFGLHGELSVRHLKHDTYPNQLLSLEGTDLQTAEDKLHEMYFKTDDFDLKIRILEELGNDISCDGVIWRMVEENIWSDGVLLIIRDEKGYYRSGNLKYESLWTAVKHQSKIVWIDPRDSDCTIEQSNNLFISILKTGNISRSSRGFKTLQEAKDWFKFLHNNTYLFKDRVVHAEKFTLEKEQIEKVAKLLNMDKLGLSVRDGIISLCLPANKFAPINAMILKHKHGNTSWCYEEYFKEKYEAYK